MDRFVDSFLIIIVIYKRKLEACESFRSVLEMRRKDSCLDIFVYDNSPIPQEIDNYKKLKINYFHDAANSGVSKAYNTGVAHAKQFKKKWVLLLDQDTSLPNTILNEYQRAITENQAFNLFVPVLKLKNGKIFSPSRYRFKRGFYLDNILPGRYSLFKLAPVNSGIMVKVTAFLKVGGYNENVPLDFSDFQFVERFRRSYPDFYVMDVTCEQDFSDDIASLEAQLIRFKYFCEGARRIEDKSVVDWFQYNGIVLLRALRLTLRYTRIDFMVTYFNGFLFGDRS